MGRHDDDDDNWFAKVAKEAENSARAKAAADRKRQAERDRAATVAAAEIKQRRLDAIKAANRKPESEVRRMAAEFGAVASGALPAHVPGSASRRPPSGGGGGGGQYNSGWEDYPTSKVTAQQGFDAISREVRNADDPYKAAGEWITKMTTELSKIAQAWAEEHPE